MKTARIKSTNRAEFLVRFETVRFHKKSFQPQIPDAAASDIVVFNILVRPSCGHPVSTTRKHADDRAGKARRGNSARKKRKPGILR